MCIRLFFIRISFCTALHLAAYPLFFSSPLFYFCRLSLILLFRLKFSSASHLSRSSSSFLFRYYCFVTITTLLLTTPYNECLMIHYYTVDLSVGICCVMFWEDNMYIAEMQLYRSSSISNHFGKSGEPLACPTKPRATWPADHWHVRRRIQQVLIQVRSCALTLL